MSKRDSGIIIRLLFLAAAAILSGCADYLNHYETVTLEAGNTQKQNMLLHSKDPFNPASRNTAIETDGQRAADAVERYRTSQQAEAAPAPAPGNVINITNNGVGTPASN
jgi:hypothetical protein